MPHGRASLTRRCPDALALLKASLPIVICALCPTLALAQGVGARVGTLRSVHIEGPAERLVITLTADVPISGRLQQISGGSTRLFVDLQGVRPQVDAVTPVDRGPVLRIRVGLNSAQPPVTRVVLDVSTAPPARIERGDGEGQLRIVVGAPDATAAAVAPPSTPTLSPSDSRQDRAWCVDLADRVAALLDRQVPSTSQAVMMAETVAWEELEREVAQRSIGPALQSIHFSLLQALRLGRIATTYRNAREFDQAAAAHAGARLLLNTTRDRLASLQ